MPRSSRARGAVGPATASAIRCAIYTRKSTEEGLQQEFNSLDAQREASEAFILSQKNEGWHVVETRYDDGGYTGGNMDRPALQRLLADINQRAVDCVVVYKVDRLSRSLLDFARICYKAQQKGWKNCKTKSVQAEAIEGAVMRSIRRLGTEPHLAEAVLAECMNQLSRRQQDLEAEQDAARRTLRQLNLELARLAADTSEDSGARFDRMGAMESEIRKAEHQLDGLARDIRSCEENPIDPEDLRRTLAEFESVWISLATREQEQLVQLLVAKVGYDGITGKVTVNFRSTGAKELCQGTL